MKRHNRPGGHDPRRPKRTRSETAPWIYGLHATAAALGNPRRRVRRVLATANAAQTLAEPLARAGVTPEIARPEAIAALLPPGAVHQGIALAADPLPDTDLGEFCAAKQSTAWSLLVVLDQVTDPQNVGAVLRSAAGFGAHGAILTRRCAPLDSPALIKAASGAVEHLSLIVAPNLARALDTLGEYGYLRIGLAGEATIPLSEAPVAERVALVLGAEGSGLRRLTREHCDLLARLPTGPIMPTLNISAAAAAALYEFARQSRAA